MDKRLQSSVPMVVTCVVAGSVLTVLAPYGTHDLAFVYRLIYWIGLCVVGGMSIVGVEFFVRRLAARPKPFPLALIHSAASTFAVFAALVAMMAAKGSTPQAADMASLLFYIWVIAMSISLVGMLVGRRDNSNEVIPVRPTLYDRLKPKLRQAEIYALSAEDHYVRVITSAGEDLILMRLSDAVKETAPLKGLSPHRSWWVAEQGVVDVASKLIHLKTGDVVPISRNGLKAVKAAGWA